MYGKDSLPDWTELFSYAICELPSKEGGGGSAGVKEPTEDGGGPSGVVDG